MTATNQSGHTAGWWARGLLFENCSCQVVCPGHVHFSQLCTYDPCAGYWAVRFEDGEIDGVSLAGVIAVIVYTSPQHMIEGNWTQVLLIDETASREQRRGVEHILTGKVGGPWAVLAQFVAKQLDTRYVPIRIDDNGSTKSVMIDGLLDSSIQAIRGRDKSKTVTFENMFNQIHAPSQVIATGGARYDDGEIVVKNDQTHALYSNFDWAVSPS
jgi:hypothetical protein